MDWGELAGQLVFSLFVTVFAYLLVPAILILSRKKYEAKILKRISIINCAVVWLLFRVIQIELGNETSSGAAVFLWGAVGYWLLKKYCLKESAPKSASVSRSRPQSAEVRASLSDEGEQRQTRRINGIYGSDVALNEGQRLHVNPGNNEQILSSDKQSSRHKQTKYTVFTIISVVVIAACVLLIFVLGGSNNDSHNNNAPSYITYENYYVGVRSITVSNESTAERIYNAWKDGKATEESMVALMDYYGAQQGGGQLYIVEPGMWIEEVDAWCFDRTRQVGDVAIIKNDYGYTICYFSSVIER